MDSCRRREDESGFTLIELLISIVVLGVIASGVGASIILFFKTADGISRRLSFSHDSQLLTNYLIPDLDSATGAMPPTVTQSGTSTGCPTGSTGISDLQLKFSDVTSQNTYTIDYAVVNGTSITRTVTSSLNQSSTVTTVVHNLKQVAVNPNHGAVCFSSRAALPWTMTVTLQAPGDPTTYSFSVTGGGRVGFTPPVGAPILCGCGSSGPPGILSQDTNGNGRLDQLVVQFDRPLNLSDAAGASQWSLNLNLVVLDPVQIYGSTVVLTIGGASGAAVPVDTVAQGLNVSLAANSDGIRSASNLPAQFTGAPVTDGMAPVPISMVAKDTNADGRVEQLVVTFSETLAGYGAAYTPWTLTLPSGSQWLAFKFDLTKAPLVSGSTGNILTLFTAGAPVDSAAAGLQLALATSSSGARDTAGNLSSFGATPVADGMAPVATSVVSKDSSLDGRIDQVVVTFSENVVPPPGYSAGYTPWTLTPPSGAQWQSLKFDTSKPPSVAGNVVTLFVTGAPMDSAAAGLQLALATSSSGARDTAGNLSSFGATPVADGMAPVATSVVSKDSSLDGRIDQVVVTFSENVVPPPGYSAGYTPWTLTPPSGAQWQSLKFDTSKPPSVAGNVVTLFVTGAPVDSAAAGLQLALATSSSGVRDTAGNLSSFGAIPVADGMGPVVIALASTGPAPGDLDPGNTITLTLSEPLAALPQNPILTLSGGSGSANTNDILSIAGVASIDLGVRNAYIKSASTATYQTTVTTSGSVVKVVIGNNITGGGNVMRADSPAPVTVTPSVSITDTASPSPNPANGSFFAGQILLF